MFIIHDPRVPHQVFTSRSDAGNIRRLASFRLQAVIAFMGGQSPQVAGITQLSFSIIDGEIDWFW